MKTERIDGNRHKVIYEPYDTDKIDYCEATCSIAEATCGEAKFFDKDGKLISRFALSMSGYQNEIPVSYDGKKAYAYNATNLKPYVSCYDVESGTLIWANDSKEIKEVCKVELFGNTLVCEVYDVGVCLINATTGEIIRWLLRNSGLSMWRITRELIAIWNRYKMKMYCYDIENDVLRVLPFDFNAKKHFNELLAQGKVAGWNVHFAMEYAKVEDGKLKVHLFISHYDFRGDYYEETPMSQVIGKGKVYVCKPRKKT